MIPGRAQERRKCRDRRKKASDVAIERRKGERRQLCACGSRNVQVIHHPLPGKSHLTHYALQCLLCGRIWLIARGDTKIERVRGGDIVV
jgi:hypothetical protein